MSIAALSGSTTPAMPSPAPAGGSVAINPQLAAIIQALPPEQQAQVLAKVQAMSPEQQQQLVTQLTSAQQQQGSVQPSNAGSAPAQAQEGAAAAQPGTPPLSSATQGAVAPAAPPPAEPVPEPEATPAPPPLPPPPRKRYRVKSGDNLSVIAARYGLTWQQLYRANRAAVGSNPNLIHPGLKLVIPKH